jgi:NodT family efflux transporter outer membrane factor (OMF) lipoprotein
MRLLARAGAAAIAVAALLPLAACTGRPPADDEREVVPLARFAEAGDAPAAWPEAGWWQGFGAPELDRLVREALAANTDLAAAAARLQQADAAARIAGAALLPSVEASAGGSRSRTGFGQNGLLGSSSSVADSYNVDLTAAWELDLWGGNRAALRAAEASTEASRFDRDGVALSVASGVAQTYVDVLSLRDRLGIARANLDNARRVLVLVEVQVANGAASALDLAQQRTQVASEAAVIPGLEQQERQAVDALAVLLGRPLVGFSVAGRSLDEITPVAVLAGIPSGILERRPDLGAAEQRLVAAAADVEAARAAFYPSISLTGRAGVASDTLVALLSRTSLLSIGVSVLAPIFEGGRLRGQVQLSQAQELELLQSYRGAILNAFADVEDALAAVRGTRQRAALLETAATEAQRAFSLGETQYRNGAIGLLQLLDAQRTLFSAEDALASARRDHLASLVSLYRALGGGWTRPGEGAAAPSPAGGKAGATAVSRPGTAAGP